MKPDPEQVLASLKDFQRNTVEYAFERLWGKHDPVKRFLVADEVGLGKTMVAKGLVAKTVEHLWDTDKRIDIVYICSNSQIARQNLSRLKVVDGNTVRHADRLTLLPNVIRNLRDNKVNFVSFTPGTSFKVGTSGGAAPERVLLYWMLAHCWGRDALAATRWKRFFEGAVERSRFEWQLKVFDRSSLDDELCLSFGDAIKTATGPGGGSLRDELEACVDEFNYLRDKPTYQLSSRRNRLIGRLRQLVSRAAVHHLEPDLVILDEFQRFKDLLDADDEGAELAHAIFDHPDAKVLLLSATPYKMYTLPDEPEGDDHYRDFIRTVRFLADDERAHIVERELRTMRESLFSGGDHTQAIEAKARVEYELRRVMCRTERLSSTANRDGMLEAREMAGARLAAEDLRSWQTFDDVARHVDRHDVFEYWRSTPYPLNLMDRNSYQVRTKFQEAAERGDTALAAMLQHGRGLMDWEDIRRYRQIDPGNAKLRGLIGDVLDRGAWQLAWLPPSLPYYELAGAYAQPELATFTKRLIFSAWSVVPKAIAVMVSYEAERRAMEAANLHDRGYDRPLTPPLQFRMSAGRHASMPTLALLYPGLVLARLGDPLDVARTLGDELPLSRDRLFEEVRSKVGEALAELPAGSDGSGPVDQSWYWAAPFLLDRYLAATEYDALLPRMRRWGGDDDTESSLASHLHHAETFQESNLGPRPADLDIVLTRMAIAGPGACALRALSRVTGGADSLQDIEIRDAAYRIAQGLRSLFNKPEIIALMRSGDDEPYWRAVLDHAMNGCLQAVLDEFAHVLIESEGLQDAGNDRRAETLSAVMVEALSIRTAANAVEQVTVTGSEISLEEHRINSHLAARYGRVQSNEQAAQRESTIRTGFNSPFRPFVLASTSVGQEGLDFHTYSHAIVHWNLPSNPVDLEQREGRVHRYKGHAVRKNVADVHGAAALGSQGADPWTSMFDAAVDSRAADDSDIKPFWIFTRPGGAVIERYVPALPLSREAQQYRRLLRTVGAYRAVIGQPRQDDLIRYVGEDVEWLRIELTPQAENS